MSLLQFNNFSLFSAQDCLVRNLNLSLAAGEWLALIGESGSGKSLSALSCLHLQPAHMRHEGEICFAEQCIQTLSAEELRSLRGQRIGFIHQEPLSALNPLQRIGQQLIEAILLHQPISRSAARLKAIRLLAEVDIDQPEQRLNAWPHELSGGQRQRVVIAMALANDPELLIADEPTTALDVLLQQRVLDLLKRLQRQRRLAILFISHDLPLVCRYADRVAVMRQGAVIELADTQTLIHAPQQAYTRELLAPFEQQVAEVEQPGTLLMSASQVSVRYPKTQHWWGGVKTFHDAVKHIGFTLNAGETLGIVGESGSGKSSLAAALLRLTPAQGRVVLSGQDWLTLDGETLRAQRAQVQMVLQDPFSSLSPRMCVGEIVAEGLVAQRGGHWQQYQQLIDDALQAVHLQPSIAVRYPHEFSGGQRQRIALARGLITSPKLLVLDEPTSALDRHTQAEVMALLANLQQRYGMALIIITHDMRVVRALCHRVLVMQQGQVVEQGPVNEVFARPQKLYTRQLLSVG